MGYSYDNYPFNGMDEDEYEFYRQEQLLEELHWAEHEQELECKDQAEKDDDSGEQDCEVEKINSVINSVMNDINTDTGTDK